MIGKNGIRSLSIAGVVLVLLMSSCGSGEPQAIDSQAPTAVTQASQVSARPSAAPAEQSADDISLDASHPDVEAWSVLNEGEVLTLKFPSVKELAENSTAVVVGKITSVDSGRSYTPQEKIPDEAPPLAPWGYTVLEIDVEAVVAGELPINEPDNPIRVGIYRSGEPRDVTKLGEGDSSFLFFVRWGATVAHDEAAIAESLGEESASSLVRDYDTHYYLTTRQGLMQLGPDGYLINPLLLAEYLAEGPEAAHVGEDDSNTSDADHDLEDGHRYDSVAEELASIADYRSVLSLIAETQPQFTERHPANG